MTVDPGVAAAHGAAPQKRKKKGLMLWIVLGGGCLSCLVCGGALTVIGVPAMSKYQRKAKASEARANLARMATLVQSYCEENGSLPPAAGPTPAMPGAHKQIGDFGSDPGFSTIGFDCEDPVYYSYAMRPHGTDTLTLVARGDLDGDGVIGEHTWTCHRVGCTCTEDVATRDQLLE